MMSAERSEREVILEMLRNSRTIAVVGISDQPERPSHGVALYLRRYYTIVPVNPRLTTWEGERCYPSLAAVPSEVTIDLVNVFRRPEHIPEVVTEVLARGAPRLWLQQGIRHEAAAAEASKGGMAVIMDACIAVEHSALRHRGALMDKLSGA